MAKTIPRPAATLILLRDGADGPEVFMLKRSPSAAFVANAYVFPGGGLDATDHQALDRVRGLSETEANRRLGIDSGGLAYWVAAVRECFEEAGILLAVDESGVPLDPERSLELSVHREAVNAGKMQFGELLARERLAIPAENIAYFSHWITAPGRPRRFSARFFVAQAPQGQHGSHDDSETVASEWVRPGVALDRGTRGEIELVHPTRVSLTELAAFNQSQRAFEFALTRAEIETNASCWAVGKDGRKLFRQDDAPYAEVHWSDPEEVGDTSYDLSHGVPKRLDSHVTRIIAPNPGMMTGPGTNAYLVGDDELVLIDPGPEIPSHLEAMLAAGAGRIKWVLCTHTHKDHSPAARLIKEATGAIVMGRPAPTGGNQDQGFAPDRVLEDGDRLSIGPLTLRAIHTPGHASNHLCYMLEQTRMLFTGDHVMQGSTVVINPPDGNMSAYLRTLEMLLAEDAAILAPGHGYLIGRPHREIRRLIAHRLAREGKVVDAMRKLGVATLEELVPAVYADVSEKLYPVAARSLAAHLGKLADDRRAIEEQGRWRLAS